MATTNLTVRIDDELKKLIEQAAALEDRSVTDFIIRAARARMLTQCPTCGRSDVPGSIPPSLTPAFDAFLAEVKKKENMWIPFLITTIELEQCRVYRGTLNHREEHVQGVVPMYLEVATRTPQGMAMLTATHYIPKGVITGWAFDQTGKVTKQFTATGYQNGNLLLSLAQLETAQGF